MTPPDEVVCFTETAFADSCLSKLDLVVRGGATPGETVTRNGRTVVYRPPATNPAPPIGCLRDEHIDALKRDGRFVLNGETILYEATPRDAAREAFEEWVATLGGTTLYVDTRTAFYAGRASVKP